MNFRRDLRIGDDTTSLVAVSGSERQTQQFTLHNASRFGFALSGGDVNHLEETFEFSIQTPQRAQPIYGVAAVRWRKNKIVDSSSPMLGARIINFYDDGSHYYLDYLSHLLSKCSAKDVMVSPVTVVDRNDIHWESQVPEDRAAFVLRSGSTILGYIDPKSDDDQFRPFAIYFTPDTPLLEIYDQLGFAGERYGAVREKGKIVGLVSSNEITPYMAELSALKYQNLESEHQRLLAAVRLDLETRMAVLKKYSLMSEGTSSFLSNYLTTFCGRIEQDVIERCRSFVGITEESGLVQRKLGDIEETLEVVGSNFYPIAMEQQIELQLDIDGAVPKVKVDHERLEQTLTAFLVEQLDGVQPWHRLVLASRCYPTKVLLRIEFLATDEPVEVDSSKREGVSEWTDWSEAPILGLCNSLIEAHQGQLEFMRLPEGAGYIYFITLPIADLQ